MSDWVSVCVVGVDIGGSKISAGLVTPEGEILRTRSVATPSTPSTILAEVKQLSHELMAGFQGEIVAIGIGSAGIIDTDEGSVIFANENLPGWTGTRLADLEIGAGLPVTVENDVRALAYGEAIMGAGAEYDSLLCVTIGTGVGGALIMDGEVWHGVNYSAGEIGYLVVDWNGEQPQILDQTVSGPAIERAYQAAIGSENCLPLTEISQLATAGDRMAIEVIEMKAGQLGFILAGYVTTVNPAAVVLGGGVPGIGALWWDAFRNAFHETLPPPVAGTPLLPATLGVNAVMLGAAMLAWRDLKA